MPKNVMSSKKQDMPVKKSTARPGGYTKRGK